ncbi:RNA-binding protein [Mucilaginibacter sp. SG564]|uniref:RNA recognition motif domain-containing protein n=1 Tax=unclassified Mucilaginibacter TaxID=2617802 RepID=UPI001556D833|nr:RNA-binding protein [Mucilaginibacter sp. SG564]NOW95303.1 RNA recognition motif-containing protein [Mucilaginibacter sp. SG564]
MKLFVGGFPLDIAEIELVKIFNSYGTVNTIKIVRDKKTRKCKGYAFLEMTDQAGADRAIEGLDGTPMGDRILSVKQAADKPAAKPPMQQRSFRPQHSNYIKTDRSSSTGSSAGGTTVKKRPRI